MAANEIVKIFRAGDHGHPLPNPYSIPYDTKILGRA
jgi:hypothetical protein